MQAEPVSAVEMRKRNCSVLLDRASDARGDDKVGKNTRLSKNIQAYTFGGRKTIKGNHVEGLIKRDDLDIKAIEEMGTYYQKEEHQSIKNERLGTTSLAKRMQSQ